MVVTIYTDGSCLRNPGGAGGYCAILTCINSKGVEVKKTVKGGSKSTTNNAMELIAVIEGLKRLNRKCDVEVYSDSQYVVNGFALGWVKNWKLHNWKTSTGSKVKNKELWIQLDKLVSSHNSCSFNWVKGHNGHPYNEECDRIARQEALIRQQ